MLTNWWEVPPGARASHVFLLLLSLLASLRPLGCPARSSRNVASLALRQAAVAKVDRLIDLMAVDAVATDAVFESDRKAKV